MSPIKTIISFILLSYTLVAFGFDLGSLLGSNTYKVLDCKEASKKTSANGNECERVVIATATFKVLKEKSQVFITYTLKENSKKVLMELENCKVIDSSNWLCGGGITTSSNAGIFSSLHDFSYQMVEGEVQTTDLYSRMSVPGYPTAVTFTKAYKFVK